MRKGGEHICGEWGRERGIGREQNGYWMGEDLTRSSVLRYAHKISPFKKEGRSFEDQVGMREEEEEYPTSILDMKRKNRKTPLRSFGDCCAREISDLIVSSSLPIPHIESDDSYRFGDPTMMEEEEREEETTPTLNKNSSSSSTTSGNSKGGYQYLKPKRPVEFSLGGGDWRENSDVMREDGGEEFLHQTIPNVHLLFALTPHQRYKAEEDFILGVLSVWENVWWAVKRESKSRCEAFLKMVEGDQEERINLREERLVEREERKVMKKEEKRMMKLQIEEKRDRGDLNENGTFPGRKSKRRIEEDSSSSSEEEEDYDEEDLDFSPEELKGGVYGESVETKRGVIGEEELRRFLEEVFYEGEEEEKKLCEALRVSLLLTYPSALRKVLRRLESRGRIQVMHRETGEILIMPNIRFCHKINLLKKNGVHVKLINS